MKPGVLLLESNEQLRTVVADSLGISLPSESTVPENVGVILIGPGLDQQGRLYELIVRSRQEYPRARVIVISALRHPEVMSRAQSLGAFDYVLLDSLGERLPEAVEKALGRKFDGDREALVPFRKDFVGESRESQEILEALERYAKSDCDVLILGETGTGKDVCAQLIHKHSSRLHEPFVALNCSAIPAHLIESHLFGHRKGAFTGATGNFDGVFARTQEGVLFLDEIGELEPSFQVKVLRVLETRTFTPVGASTEHRFQGRILYATNRDLRLLVDKNQFRADLYHRICANQLWIPPLRKRRQDILPLTRLFIAHSPRSEHPPAISDEVQDLLLACPFDGNVRQLKAVISHAILHLDESETEILPRHLPLDQMFRSAAHAPEAGSESFSGVLKPKNDPATGHDGYPGDVREPSPQAGSHPMSSESKAQGHLSADAVDPELLARPWREAMAEVEQAFNRKYLAHQLMNAHHNVSKAARASGLDPKTFRVKWCRADLGPLK